MGNRSLQVKPVGMTEDAALAIAMRALGGGPVVDVMEELVDVPEPVYASDINEAIRILHARGLNDKQIARHPSIPVKESAVRRRRENMGLESNHTRAKNASPPERRTKEWWALRDASIADMVNDGYTDQDIARTLGISPAYVRKSRTRQGLPMNRAQAPNRGQYTGEESERVNAAILAMWKEGKEDVEMAEVLGLRPTAVRMRRVKQGLAAHRPSHRPIPPERLELMAKVAQLNQLGRTDRQVADELGIPAELAARLRRRQGLDLNPGR